jgi:protein-S-isoprenylcysteine O-methyltransferase Ste14
MKINVKVFIGQIVGMCIILALAVFLPTGNVTWLTGWIFLILASSGLIMVNIWLFKNNPELLQERMSLTRSDQKEWDKLLSPVLLAYPMVSLVFISFDGGRFHWSPVPLWVQGIGAAALLCSFALFLWTFRENTFLSAVVRIQKDRGHKVVSTGPYHYVRHPMYAAFVIVDIGTPLLLGSWYGVLLGVIFIIMVARRAVLEERALEQELDGYSAYMQQVKYRFIPFIW